MKKRITDFMDDLPAEEVENLMNRTAGKKRRRPSFGTFKIAVAAACIAALGGGVAYAYTHPGFLQEYLGIFRKAEKDDYVKLYPDAEGKIFAVGFGGRMLPREK